MTEIQTTPRLNVGIYDIEIVDITMFDSGINVFARVWQGGEQIGFGKDGSVDIERFRFINPDFIKKDNAPQILLEELASTVGAMTMKHSSENIEVGKRGNTTSTFYPSSGATEPVDGYVGFGSATNDTWANRRADTDSENTDIVGPTMNIARIRADATTDRWDIWYRGIMGFPTSSIPDTDEIYEVALILKGSAVATDTLGSQSLVLDRAVPASTDTLATTDFDLATYWDGVEQAGNRIASGDWVTGDNTYRLNAVGRGNVSKTSLTWFGFRLSSDFDDVEPTWVSGNQALFPAHEADASTSTNRPRLVVEHSAASVAADIDNHTTLKTSLISWWEPNGTVFEDQHASNDLTNTGCVAITPAGGLGDGLDFEAGDTDHQEITDASQTGLEPTGDMSGAFAFRPESVPTSDMRLWGKDSNSGTRSHYMDLYYVGGQHELMIFTEDGYTNRVPVTLVAGTDTLLGFSLDEAAGTLRIYQDGVQIGATITGVVNNSVNNTHPFVVGIRDPNGDKDLDGVVYRFGMWSKALTAAEHSDLWDDGSVLQYAAVAGSVSVSMGTQTVTSSVIATTVVVDAFTLVGAGTVTVSASSVPPALLLTSVSTLNVGVLTISLGGVSVLTGGNISVGLVTQDLTASVVSPTVTAETDGESTAVVVIMGTVSMVVSTVPRPVEGLVWNRIARTV